GRAGEDWARQFQKDEVPAEVEEVSVNASDVGGSTDSKGLVLVRLDRLVVKCGLAESATDAARKLKQSSVRIDNQIVTEPRFVLTGPSPTRLTMPVGKKLKFAVVQWGLSLCRDSCPRLSGAGGSSPGACAVSVPIWDTL